MKPLICILIVIAIHLGVASLSASRHLIEAPAEFALR
jgi:hypothetical protein